MESGERKNECWNPHTLTRDIESVAGSLLDYFGYARATSDAQPDQASVFYRV